MTIIDGHLNDTRALTIAKDIGLNLDYSVECSVVAYRGAECLLAALSIGYSILIITSSQTCCSIWVRDLNILLRGVNCISFSIAQILPSDDVGIYTARDIGNANSTCILVHLDEVGNLIDRGYILILGDGVAL